MVEVQSHGFSFERWVRDTLFEGYSGNYMQKWDIPPDCNQHEAIPVECRGIPVSVKTAKYGSPIGLGDVIRQRTISEPFLMIVGFWHQRTPSEKWFEEIAWVRFEPELWDSLWGKLRADEIKAIDTRIKDISAHYSVVRADARAWKRAVADNSGNKIVINPKIDSKKQRRIQCSLPFNIFWNLAGREPNRTDVPSLFGFEFENPILSEPRKFNQA